MSDPTQERIAIRVASSHLLLPGNRYKHLDLTYGRTLLVVDSLLTHDVTAGAVTRPLSLPCHSSVYSGSWQQEVRRCDANSDSFTARLSSARLSSARLSSARVGYPRHGTEKTLLRLLMRNRGSVFRCYNSYMA
jgi:hypothetical protein